MVAVDEPNRTEGVEKHSPAEPARPGSGPAASLTAGGHHLWRVQELGSLADWVPWVAVAVHTSDGGKNDSHAVHKQNMWWLVVPAETATSLWKSEWQPG